MPAAGWHERFMATGGKPRSGDQAIQKIDTFTSNPDPLGVPANKERADGSICAGSAQVLQI